MKYVGVSAPAWTILGKWKDQIPQPKSDNEEEFSPPPVLDNKNLIKSQPRIVTKPRQRQEKVFPPPKEMKTPPPVKTKRKKPMISKAERFPVPKDAGFGVGPTSYQPDIITGSIAAKMPNFSFGYRFDSELPKKENELIELPVHEPIPLLHYPQFKHKEHAKAITFPRADKDGLNLITASKSPGPGKYNPHEPRAYEKPKSKIGTFGNPKDPNAKSESTKDDDYAGSYPSYNEYVPPKSVPKHKGITRSLSEQQIKKPLPVQPSSANFFDEHFYKFKAKGPKWKFGDSTRPPLNVTNQTNLGPGEYMGLGSQFNPKDINKHSLPRLPQAQRRPLNENNKVPGPGTYPLEVAEDDAIGQRLKSKLHGPAFSMRGKYPPPGSVDHLRMPGPGQYEVHNMNQIGMDKNKIGPTVYASERGISTLKKDYDGPDMYNITKDLGSDEGIKFPKSKRKPMATATDPDIDLGPGYYDLKSTVPQLQPFEQAKFNQLENFNLNLI